MEFEHLHVFEHLFPKAVALPGFLEIRASALTAAPADKIDAVADEWPELLGGRDLTTRLFTDGKSPRGGLFRGSPLNYGG